MKNRCGWTAESELFYPYHDEEWGRPVHDDQKLFEMLILEGMQAGLSWLTILKKRDNFRQAFDNFDPQIVANYGEEKHQELLQNPGIIRNRLKVKAATINAQAFLQVQKDHGSFSHFIWQYVNHTPIVNRFATMNDLPATTELSDKISKDLKKLGFKFVGSTIIYAFMQATGMVNDHTTDCFLCPT